jgi:HAD superfamily hydrolase (TIGR01662 family)
MTSGQLSLIHEHMLNKVQAFNGRIDAVFAATSLKKSDLKERKPHPFMALQAKNKFPEIDFHKSIMVGDTDSDIQFGKNLGMKTVLIRSKEVISSSPDVVLESLDQLIFLNL